eukprot:1161582-Pelagomonas_calceolata.AAC.5
MVEAEGNAQRGRQRDGLWEEGGGEPAGSGESLGGHREDAEVVVRGAHQQRLGVGPELEGHDALLGHVWEVAHDRPVLQRKWGQSEKSVHPCRAMRAALAGRACMLLVCMDWELKRNDTALKTQRKT